jgi:hypothetical protein
MNEKYENEMSKRREIFLKRQKQQFPNFSGARTTKNILVIREAQNTDLY